jgi:hypothetical protein
MAALLPLTVVKDAFNKLLLGKALFLQKAFNTFYQACKGSL